MNKPTREQVLAEPPGQRLDCWVAKRLMGYIHPEQHGCPLYSRDSAAAFGTLLKRMTSNGWCWECGDVPWKPMYASFWRRDRDLFQATACDTPAHAMARAALLAELEEPR